MSHVIPRGSMWRVEHAVGDVGLRATYNPAPITGLHFREFVYYEPGELVVVGDEVVVQDTVNSYFRFVEVLTPKRAWLNRVHFNEGRGFLTRLA